MSWLVLIAFGRVLAEVDSPPPEVTDDAVLFIKRTNAIVGCTSGDAGVPGDAATDAALSDGGALDAGFDDAGVDDAGLDDGGLDDGGCTLIAGDAISLVVQPRVTASAGGARFAVLYVTPGRPVVEVVEPIFEELHELTARKVVVRQVEIADARVGTQCKPDGCFTWSSSGGDGCGGGASGDYWSPPDFDGTDPGDGGVGIETVGPYEIVRAQPADSAELASWLDQLGYDYQQQDLDAVAPYIAQGFTVTAVRVAMAPEGTLSLVPLQLTWAGSEIRIPLGLTSDVAGGILTVFIVAEGRYEFTRGQVTYADDPTAAGFITRNLVNLGWYREDPVATRAAYDERFHDVVERVEVNYVPVEIDCDDGCGRGTCSARPRGRIDMLAIVVAIVFVVRRPRRRLGRRT